MEIFFIMFLSSPAFTAPKAPRFGGNSQHGPYSRPVTPSSESLIRSIDTGVLDSNTGSSLSKLWFAQFSEDALEELRTDILDKRMLEKQEKRKKKAQASYPDDLLVGIPSGASSEAAFSHDAYGGTSSSQSINPMDLLHPSQAGSTVSFYPVESGDSYSSHQHHEKGKGKGKAVAPSDSPPPEVDVNPFIPAPKAQVEDYERRLVQDDQASLASNSGLVPSEAASKSLNDPEEGADTAQNKGGKNNLSKTIDKLIELYYENRKLATYEFTDINGVTIKRTRKQIQNALSNRRFKQRLPNDLLRKAPKDVVAQVIALYNENPKLDKYSATDEKGQTFTYTRPEASKINSSNKLPEERQSKIRPATLNRLIKLYKDDKDDPETKRDKPYTVNDTTRTGREIVRAEKQRTYRVAGKKANEQPSDSLQ
jgi:hypothetical protein